ncbi:hypothetical protein SGLAM104S_03949 [Streptomyces glaucescens]
MATASMSAQVRLCPSRTSVRTFSLPCTTTGSPRFTEAVTFAASCRLAHTVKKFVWPSVQVFLSRSR